MASAELDQLAQRFYNPSSAEDAAAARSVLSERFEGNVNALMDALVVTESPYTAMLCSVALVPAFKKAITGDLNFDAQNRIFGGVFDTLLKITLDPSVNQLMGQVRRVMLSALCRMNKLVLEARSGQSYLIDRALQTISPDSDLANAPPEAAVALEVLAGFVHEAQLHDSNRASQFMTFGQHRRASTSLRDGPLRDLFVYTIEMLRKVRSLPGPPSDELLRGLTALAETVMTYDFMAIIVDETEEMYVTQFPAEWKEVLTEDALQVVGWAHLHLGMPHCHTMLRALIGLIGTRRSFYDSDEIKTSWLEFFMQQIIAVEDAGDGRLGHTDYCNAVAEAIARFTPPHGYRDLIKCASAQQFFTFAANFSMTMFNIPFGDGNSFSTTTTLMQFWSRAVGSKRLALSDEEAPGQDIETFIPSMVSAFVKTRITEADFDVDEDAIHSINTQSDLLPGILKLCPEQCLQLILTDASSIGEARIAACNSTMIWVCYLVGGLVRHWFGSVTEELAPAAAALLNFASACVNAYQQASNRSDSSVENAVVYFLMELQHTFASARISAGLQKVVDEVFQNKTNLFQFIIQSVGSNMLSTVLEPATIRNSIEVIVDACKELPHEQLSQLTLDLPPTETLPLSQHVDTFRLRTQLTKALYTVRVGSPATHETFCRFMQPLEANMRSGNTDPLFVAGWLRDLRGVAAVASSLQNSNAELLDWLMERDELMSSLSSNPGLPPIIVNSFNKFLLQLVQPNYPSSRVNIPPMAHSAAGIHLFQFVSSHLQNLITNSVMRSNVLQALQAGQPDSNDTWHAALKPIQVSMEIVRRCVAGEFCPFGAMMLYGDNRFDVLFCGIISVIRTIPSEYYKQFGKLSASLQYLLRTINEVGLLSPFAALPVEDLLALIARSLEVVSDADEKATVTSHALNFLSLIGSLYPDVVRIRTNAPDPHHRNSPSRSGLRYRDEIARKLADQESLFDDLVIAAMNVVTTQDRGLSPAASTVFPIFETDPGKWQQYRGHLIGQYAPAKQAKVLELLDNLGGNVASSDTFFSNLVTFRMGIRML
uniref:Uncharacterized protein n=1 Tax=Neobodo designis TaxID=312471 RepID=A0A7S1MEX9_NEODS|mmetsp:Transcript_39222/g.121229  ORF Transcript_39222/g.121229 Transcript_39222/m.121229 type:complete len:1051 (+) Transcript_39222:155-3307(+)